MISSECNHRNTGQQQQQHPIDPVCRPRVINNSSSSITSTNVRTHSCTAADIAPREEALVKQPPPPRRSSLPPLPPPFLPLPVAVTSHPHCKLPNMASSRVAEREVREEEARRTADLHLSPHKHSLLIIVGRTAHPGQTGHVGGEIERGTFALSASIH